MQMQLYNPFGSLKDRAGYAMLKMRFKIKENNMTVIESSSRNTAKSTYKLYAV